MSIRTILAKCAFGQPNQGVKLGAEMIADKLKLKPTTILGFRHYIDYFSLSEHLKINLESVETNVIIGGDHSISSATVPMFFNKFRENGHLIWIVAHPDINTVKTSPSKNTHGMPVAKIFGHQ